MEKTIAARAGRREWTALAVLALAVLLLAVDGTVLALAVPALSAALDPSATELLWIGDAYSFALAGLLVTMGALGDRIGRKKLLLIGAAGFAGASVLAAFAPTAGWLIAARVLLGVAGATLMPSTLSIIRAMFPDPRQRTTAVAVWGAMAMAGAAAGPLVGGVLLEHFWWGSVFLINLPVMALLIGLGIPLLLESRNPSPGPFDPLSAVLSAAGIVGPVYALKEVATGHVGLVALAAAGLGAVALVAFVRRQRRLPVPLIDVSLFGTPQFSGALVANVLSIFALSGMLYFVSQYLQLVRGFGPLEAGIRELPLTLGSLVVTAFVGMLLARVGRGRLIGAGLAVAAAGLAALAVEPGHDLAFTLALVAIGVGVGLALTLTTDAIVSAVPAERAGAASAVSETGYELGVALGIAVLGSVLTAVYRAALPAGAPAAAVESLASTSGIADPAVLDAARSAFVTAMQVTSGVAAAVTALAAVLAVRLVPADR